MSLGNTGISPSNYLALLRSSTKIKVYQGCRKARESKLTEPSVAWSSSAPGMTLCGDSAVLRSIFIETTSPWENVSSTGCGSRCQAFRYKTYLAGGTSSSRLFKRGIEKAIFSFRRRLAVSSIERCQCKLDERDIETRLGGGCCHQVIIWQWS
jgi:hypothetical protein